MDDPSLPHEFAAVGECIYCGCSNAKTLHLEHIVPQGLGGRFELPKASCPKCEGITSNIEGAVLRGLYHAPRARLGLLSKKRKQKHPTEWPIEIDFGTKTEPKRVPIAKHPTFLFGLILSLPTALIGIPAPEDKKMTFVIRPLAENHNAIIKELGPKVKVSARYDGIKYARMLAKIGHSYAVAKLGLGNFKPLLQDLIRFGRDKSQLELQDQFPLDLIGGPIQIEPPKPGNQLHEISVDQWDEFIVVRLRLFSNFGMPVYYIVAGTA